MAPFTIISEDGIAEIEADVRDGAVVMDALALSAATGWADKPQGLCRGDVCIPARSWSDGHRRGEFDLAEVARVTGQVLALDLEERVATIAPDATSRAEAMGSLRAADFTVADIDGVAVSLADFRGRKKLLVAFASW